jgi:hypothetical protein
MTQPLFSGEGPEYYSAAYAHNAPFARPGPYQTPLTPAEEQAFLDWVKKNNVPFDPTAQTVDYDMRGYWRSTGGSWRGGHFPDTYKTPYDTTFSAESKYATANCPFVWKGDSLVDQRNGQLIYGTPIAKASNVTPQHGYQETWHLEAVAKNGTRRVVEARMLNGGVNATDWEVELRPGETLDVVAHGNVTVT